MAHLDKLTDPAARQGLYGGLVLGSIEIAVLLVINAIHGWTTSAPVEITLLVLYAIAFALVGALGSQRADVPFAGARAGAIAGVVVALAFLVGVAINSPSQLGTMFGWAIILPALVGGVAALLGEAGGSVVEDRRASRPVR